MLDDTHGLLKKVEIYIRKRLSFHEIGVGEPPRHEEGMKG
jgi:hypothetical protein